MMIDPIYKIKTEKKDLLGKGGIVTTLSGTYYVPSWTKVEQGTTLNQIEVEVIVPEKDLFKELFVEEEKWTFESSSSSQKYTVRYNKRGELSCDCMGYITRRKCKHIEEVKKEI